MEIFICTVSFFAGVCLHSIFAIGKCYAIRRVFRLNLLFCTVFEGVFVIDSSLD